MLLTHAPSQGQKPAPGNVGAEIERKRAGRTALTELIDNARDGDIVVVGSMDRLACSVVDLNQIVGGLVAKGVIVWVTQLSLT